MKEDAIRFEYDTGEQDEEPLYITLLKESLDRFENEGGAVLTTNKEKDE